MFHIFYKDKSKVWIGYFSLIAKKCGYVYDVNLIYSCNGNWYFMLCSVVLQRHYKNLSVIY